MCRSSWNDWWSCDGALFSQHSHGNNEVKTERACTIYASLLYLFFSTWGTKVLPLHIFLNIIRTYILWLTVSATPLATFYLCRMQARCFFFKQCKGSVPSGLFTQFEMRGRAVHSLHSRSDSWTHRCVQCVTQCIIKN